MEETGPLTSLLIVHFRNQAVNNHKAQISPTETAMHLLIHKLLRELFWLCLQMTNGFCQQGWK